MNKLLLAAGLTTGFAVFYILGAFGFGNDTAGDFFVQIGLPEHLAGSASRIFAGLLSCVAVVVVLQVLGWTSEMDGRVVSHNEFLAAKSFVEKQDNKKTNEKKVSNMNEKRLSIVQLPSLWELEKELVESERAEMNFTQELSKLLAFTGDVGTAIRMYSCYAKPHSDFNEIDSHEVKLLSDALHHLSELSQRISAADTIVQREKQLSRLPSSSHLFYADIISMAKELILVYRFLNKTVVKKGKTQYALFNNPHIYNWVDFEIAINALENIVYKCKTGNSKEDK